MTSEVCLLNRRAAVLAADSAVTLTHYDQGRLVESYHKGANKIFQLSLHHPVGMMIFDSADILQVPWEIIAKDFRSHIADKSFNTLEEYAAEFFEYLNKSVRCFPETVQNDTLVDIAENAMIRFYIDNSAPRDSTESDDERRLRVTKAIESRRGELDALPFAPGLSAELLNASIANLTERLVSILEGRFHERSDFPPRDHPSLVAELGFMEVFKRPVNWMPCTGLVFAGFGDHDVFPKVVEFTSCGIIGSHHVAIEKSKDAIDHGNLAVIKGFAQTSMIDTFALGLSEDVFHRFASQARNGFEEFAAEIAQASGGDLSRVPNLAELTRKQQQKISSFILAKAREEHGAPLRRVLGSLSIEEMCELAETLINLQSLKEKVTKPSASVGGPIDVAAITRGEGLIWIKRKHYFDPALNPRYVQRRTSH